MMTTHSNDAAPTSINFKNMIPLKVQVKIFIHLFKFYIDEYALGKW